MQLPKDLKDAISKLPSIEKDKLIFRLLKKDIDLTNRLLFELIGSTTVEEEREIVKANIARKIIYVTQHCYSCGYLNMDVREVSGYINEHVRITKDKYGEVSLNLFLLTEVLEQNKNNIINSPFENTRKFCVPIIARVFKVLILISKMHADYLLDFKSEIEKTGKLISENKYLMETAIRNGLDVNWLLHCKIPENIESIHKKIRNSGFLK